MHSRALLGLEAPAVTVEVHLANGLPSFTLVGLADTEVKEARERVRAAMQNAGLEFPHNKRITVNLAPADLPKDSGRFDLPIALGILAASGQIDAARLAATNSPASCRCRASCGRCAVRWRWRWRCSRAARRRSLVLPRDSADEAALVPGAQVYGARHLLDVVRQFLPEPRATPRALRPRLARACRPRRDAAARYADLRDVKGQAGAKRALEIAAAGGHSLLDGRPARVPASRCWRSASPACCRR